MKSRNIKKTFTRYVTMNVLGMMGISCYILADTFFVARGIGTDGLAALNLAIPIYSFVNGIGLMIGMGAATRFSISKSKSIFTQALYLTLICSLLFFLTGVFLPNQLASVLGADFITHQMTSTYLQIILCFSPMFMLNNLIICFIRNDGNPRLSMTAMLLGSLSNIILDYLFVIVLNMGMFGAAIATGIAPIISLMILSTHIIRKKNSFNIVRVKPALLKFYDISLLGISSLIAELSSGIVIIIFNKIIIGHAGNVGIAAYGIIANIALVVNSVFTGVSQGMQPIVSSSYGTREYHNIRKVLRYGLVLVSVLSIMIYLSSYIFADPIVSVFNKDHDLELMNIATEGIRIYFVAYIFAGINILYATYFGAIDKPKNAFLISILRGFVIILPLVYLMSLLFGLPGVWISMPFTEMIVLGITIYLFSKSKSALSLK